MEPPIELDELMERIRAAASAKRQAEGIPEHAAPRPIQPPIPDGLSIPPAQRPPLDAGVDRAALEVALVEVASMLPRARQKTEVGAAVPPLLRSFFRNQGGFNGVLLETASRLLDANRQLQRQNVQLQERLESMEASFAQQHAWTVAASRNHDEQRKWMAAIETYLVEMDGSQADRERQLRRRVAKERAVVPPEAGGAVVEPFSDEWLALLQDQLKTVDGHANRLGDHLKNLQAQVDEQGVRHGDWHDQYRQATVRHEAADKNVRRIDERQHNDASYFKNQLWFLQRLIEPLLANRPPSYNTVSNGQESPLRMDHALDALYLAFEEVMRGSRAEVKERLGVYLPYITAANAGTMECPVLDLGCGRGEWLELLGEHGLSATGVDLNVCMIEHCQERGLPVTFANALDHLRGLPDASCGAITAFHFIEHLPFAALVAFLRDCRRVLQPGGVAIFETPNPYNVLVGSGFFYHDFTHQRPLPPNSTKFLVEQLGFATVEVVPLHPWDEAAKVHGEGAEALEWRFNELFYGPQDYALIAKP